MISPEKLSQLKLFSGMSPAVLAGLGQAMDEKTFVAGATVMKEGDKSGCLFLIAQGQVTVEAHSKVVARLEAEEFFGEMSFVSNEPHSATITAAEKTTVYMLPRAAVDMLIQKQPMVAIDQMRALFAGVSGRLRRTTEELVTVFDVARLIGGAGKFDQLMRSVLERVLVALNKETSAAFYTWNPFNDEYNLVSALGSEQAAFPAVLATAESALPFSKSGLLLSRIDAGIRREGLFVYYNGAPTSFDAGERQLVETISAVMMPALESARAREEADARERLTRSKQASL